MSIPNPIRSTGFALATATLFLGSCSKEETADSGTPEALALVGDEAVTEAEFRHAWKQGSPRSDTPTERREILESLIERSAMAEAAEAAGLAEDPIVLAQLEKLLIGRFKETQLRPELESASVTDEEIQAYYEKHRDSEFVRAGRTRAAVLWMATRGQQPLVDRYTPRLETIRESLIQDPDSIPTSQGFGSHARRNSEHRVSRIRGGDLGWVRDHSPADAFHTTVLAMASDLSAPGELSPVTATPEGLFLIRLIGREEADALPLSQVRQRIHDELLSQKRKDIEAAFVTRCMEGAEVVRFPERLDQLNKLPATAQEPGFQASFSQNGSR